MKSEERHQLHENDLASAVDRILKKVEPYSNQILIGILVATVAAVGFLIWRRSSGGASEAAWAAFVEAEGADAFATMADEYPTTDVANWARLRAAEQYLNQGLRTATSDRKATEDNLKQAEETLQKLLDKKSEVPSQIRERALYAMAVCRETLSTGDTKPAIAAFKALQDEFPQSQYVSIAGKRIADLESDATREFYAWFDQQPRKPEDRPKPKDVAGPLTGTADPFVLGEDPITTQPQHPDRPPSPSAPVRPGTSAAPFPETDDAESSPPKPTPPSEETASPEPEQTPSGESTPRPEAPAPMPEK